MRFKTNNKFKNFQFKFLFYLYLFFEKTAIKYLPHHLLCLDNNLYKNDKKIVFEPIKLNESLKFLYL